MILGLHLNRWNVKLIIKHFIIFFNRELWVGMVEDTIELDFTIVAKILKQLINSDGMEVTNKYLIEQKIYYIDNVSLIEELETIIMTQLYEQILERKGNVNPGELFDKYTPQYINYDKLFNTLQKKNNQILDDEKSNNKTGNDGTLNKYF